MKLSTETSRYSVHIAFLSGSPPNTVINLRSCLLHKFGQTFLFSTVEVNKDIESLVCGANVACVHQGIKAMSPGCNEIKSQIFLFRDQQHVVSEIEERIRGESTFLPLLGRKCIIKVTGLQYKIVHDRELRCWLVVQECILPSGSQSHSQQKWLAGFLVLRQEELYSSYFHFICFISNKRYCTLVFRSGFVTMVFLITSVPNYL